MTNLQFYSLLTVAIGSLITVILAWIYSNARTARLELTTDANFRDLNTKVDTVSRDLNSKYETMSHDLREFYRSTGKLEGRVEEIAKR